METIKTCSFRKFYLPTLLSVCILCNQIFKPIDFQKLAVLSRDDEDEEESEPGEMSSDTQNFLSNLTFGNESDSQNESDIESGSEEPSMKKAKFENNLEEEYDYSDEDEAFDTAELEKFALQKIQK